MNKKQQLFIILIIAGLSVLAFLMKKQADQARAVSDSILRDFKTVDKDLKRSTDSLEQTMLPVKDTSIKP